MRLLFFLFILLMLLPSTVEGGFRSALKKGFKSLGSKTKAAFSKAQSKVVTKFKKPAKPLTYGSLKSPSKPLFNFLRRTDKAAQAMPKKNRVFDSVKVASVVGSWWNPFHKHADAAADTVQTVQKTAEIVDKADNIVKSVNKVADKSRKWSRLHHIFEQIKEVNDDADIIVHSVELAGRGHDLYKFFYDKPGEEKVEKMVEKVEIESLDDEKDQLLKLQKDIIIQQQNAAAALSEFNEMYAQRLEDIRKMQFLMAHELPQDSEPFPGDFKKIVMKSEPIQSTVAPETNSNFPDKGINRSSDFLKFF